MNYLSNKLSNALTKDVLTSQKSYRTMSPSSASIELIDAHGQKKVVGACLRQQYYRLKGFIPDEGGRNIDWNLSAMLGEKAHELLAQLIDLHGFSMGLQRLATEHSFVVQGKGIGGRTDLILWDYNSNEPIGVEIKSIGEFKAKKAMEQPIDEHLLQSVIYLDHYAKTIPKDQIGIKKWYLWYISRTENWSLKAKDHNSPFTMLWDYCITLEDGVPIVHGSNFNQKLTQYSIENIYKRFDQLRTYLDTNQVPPRDYEERYSEEKLTHLYKTSQIPTKRDTEIIEKWLNKGATPGKLNVVLGDAECKFCEFSKACWSGVQNTTQPCFSNLPKKDNIKEPVKQEKISDLFI